MQITTIAGDTLHRTIANTIIGKNPFDVISGDPVSMDRQHVTRILGQD